jgi:hypothetical protein
MTTNNNKLIHEVLDGFQKAKGRCAVRAYKPINAIELAFHVIMKFWDKSPSEKVLIVIYNDIKRQDIKDLFEANMTSMDNIDILSAVYLKPSYKYNYRLIITIGLNDNIDIIDYLLTQCKFLLCLLTAYNKKITFFSELSKLLPIINTNITQEVIRRENIYSPVKETCISVELEGEDRKEYDKCTDFINTSMAVFGDFENITRCKQGDVGAGISASEFRYQLAKANGWNETMDMTIDFNRQVDTVFNPNTLYERACTAYNIMKTRRDLVTDGTAKFIKIKEIIEANPQKKIIVLSKRGEYAAKVTKYLNNEGILCLDYHDEIEHEVATDENDNIILVKSGKDKGKPKIIAAQAICNKNLKRFNEDKVNVLSIKEFSNKDITCDVDILIITSCLCDWIYNIKDRFTNMRFTSIPNEVYRIFFMETVDDVSHTRWKKLSFHETIYQNAPVSIKYDEISGDVII